MMSGFWHEKNVALIDEGDPVHFNLMEDIRCLKEAISDHKETVTGTDVKPMGVDHCLWMLIEDE